MRFLKALGLGIFCSGLGYILTCIKYKGYDDPWLIIEAIISLIVVTVALYLILDN